MSAKACNAAAGKIMRLIKADEETRLHPVQHEHGYDPLHTDHKEHITHKQVSHGGHHDAKEEPKAEAK